MFCTPAGCTKHCKVSNVSRGKNRRKKKVKTRPSEQGESWGPCHPPPNIFQQSESALFQQSVNIFYLAWHNVKSRLMCIPSKIMIKFACSVMSVIIYHDIS